MHFLLRPYFFGISTKSVGLLRFQFNSNQSTEVNLWGSKFIIRQCCVELWRSCWQSHPSWTGLNRRATQRVSYNKGLVGLLRHLPTSLWEHSPKSKPGPPGQGWGMRLTASFFRTYNVEKSKREAKAKIKWLQCHRRRIRSKELYVYFIFNQGYF